MELSRKNRSLSAELASEQNKVKQLENKLKDLTSEHSQLQSDTQSLSATKSVSSPNCDNQGTKVNV